MSAITDATTERDDVAGHLVALAELPGIGPATLLRCMDAPDLHRLWADVVSGRAQRVPELADALGRSRSARSPVGPAELAEAARGLSPGTELARHRADGRRVLLLGAEDYPARLGGDPSPPAVLFAAGDLQVLEGPTVAIVGTRNATRAGRELAGRLAVQLAAVGVSVVSGLALGIDGAAHQALVGSPRITAEGRPVGVVASGLDVAYPACHARLHRDVERNGLLVSEVPLGHRPAPWRFPARNRIIAGLADAVVVVESRTAGGSMLTAAEGLARDVPVLAVPGHPTAPAAAGTNDLIADGAILVRDVEDVLVAIGRGGARPVRPGPSAAAPVPEAVTDAAEVAVLAALGVEPLGLAEVVERVGLGFSAASVALAALEGRGLVQRSGGWFERAGSGSPDGLPAPRGRS